MGYSGSPNIDPSFYTLVAHLLQQFVDERASEHVEKVGSNLSIDALARAPASAALHGCRSCNGRMRLCAVNGGNRYRPFPRCGGG